jgi:hypothetical protein
MCRLSFVPYATPGAESARGSLSVTAMGFAISGRRLGK